MQNPEDISNPTTAFDMALVLMAKAFTLNDTTPTNNNRRSSSNPSNMQIAQPGMNMDQDRQMLMVEDNVRNQCRQNAVQNCCFRNCKSNRNTNVVTAPAEGNGNGNGINVNSIRCYNCRGEGHYVSNCIVKPRKRDAAYLQQQLQITQEEEAGIQSTQVEFKFMATTDAFEETERVKANCILENNLQQASTSEERYTELLEPIPRSHQVPQNDSNVSSEVSSMEQNRGRVEQHPTNVEETCVLYDSLYNNLAIEVEKVNSVNRKLKETNVDLTTEQKSRKVF
nr:hypothetical protein [Tanacetum cinerariifolium]